jgi:hypothetical protein
MLYLTKGEVNDLVLNINNNARPNFTFYDLVFTHVMSRENKTYTIDTSDPLQYTSNIRYCTLVLDLATDDLNYEGQYTLNIYGVGDGDPERVYVTMVVLNGEAESKPFTEYVSPNEVNENYIYIQEDNAPPQPTPSVTPTNTVTPTPSITPTNTVTPTPSITPTITPTNTVTPTPTVTPSATPVPPLDPDATAYINAVLSNGGTLSAGEQTAIDTLFVDLKTNSLYNKFYAIYPFAGAVASSNMLNAKNPIDSDAAFRITFSGGWVHDTNGSNANGSNCLGNTHIQAINHLIDFDKSYAMYQSEVNTLAGGWEGMYQGGSADVFGLNLYPGNASVSVGLNVNYGSVYFPPTFKGCYITTLTSAADRRLYYNGIEAYVLTDKAPNPFTLPLDYYLGCLNSSDSPILFNNFQHNFYSLGSSLTPYEAVVLNTIIINFLTSMGRI